MQVMQKLLHVNTFGTFVVDACIADAINSQYPDNGPFAPRVKEERGCIVNISSVVAKPVPARCLTYGTSKSKASPCWSMSSAEQTQLPSSVSPRVFLISSAHTVSEFALCPPPLSHPSSITLVVW